MQISHPANAIAGWKHAILHFLRLHMEATLQEVLDWAVEMERVRAALYRGMIQRIEDDPITVMILTLVSAIAVEEVIKQVFGTQPAVISSLLTGQVSIAGGIQMNNVLVFVLSWLIIGMLFVAIN